MKAQAKHPRPAAPLESKVVVSMMFRDPCVMGRTCNACGTFIKQSKKAGYTNLISHLAGKHSGYEDVVRGCLREKRKVSMDMFIDRDALTTFQWMKLVVLKNFTFADVDDEDVRSAVRFDSMSSKTLKARMFAAVELVEPAIIDELKGEKFVVVFDGVTHSAEHSLAVFAVTRKGARFLALSSFVDEASMTADEHIRFLDMILDQYRLIADNLIAIVCDNMETNKAIARRCKAPMIGCAAHRFNLAVKDHVKEHEAIIKKVAVLMRKLKTVKRIAVLKKNGCKLKPVPMHELRWSGLHRMLKRYDQLHPFLHLFERDIEVDRDLPSNTPTDDSRRFPIVKFLPSAEENCQIMDVLDEMKILDLATKRLQSEDLNLVTARDILDEVLVDFPELEDRLKADAEIVESKLFEAAVVKIMQGREQDLTMQEKNAAKRLLRFPEREVVSSSATRKRNKTEQPGAKSVKKKRSKAPAKFTSQPLPRRPGSESSEIDEEATTKTRRTPAEVAAAIAARAKSREDNRSRYIDLTWVPATSVEVERLFSRMKCTLGYLRRSMSAETLEAILFLRMNWDLVTNEVTSKAVRTAREEDVDEDEDCDICE